MTEYAFFTEKADRWGKDMASLVGEPQHLSPPLLARTPLSFPSRIILYKQPQSLGEHTKTLPQHYLSAGLGRKCHEGQAIWHLLCMGEP